MLFMNNFHDVSSDWIQSGIAYQIESYKDIIIDWLGEAMVTWVAVGC